MGEVLSITSSFANTPSGPGAMVSAARTVTRPNSSSSDQANIGSSDSNYQPQPNSSTRDQAASSPTARDLTKGKNQRNRMQSTTDNADATKLRSVVNPMHDNNPNKKYNLKSKSSSNIDDNKDNKDNNNKILRSKSFSDSDSDVNRRTPVGENVQKAPEKKNSSTDIKTLPKIQDSDTELVLKKTVKPVSKKTQLIPEPKPWMFSRQFNNYLTPQFRETPYKSAPYIKNAVMIYDTIDEAIKTKEGYPYTKLFAQTNKTRKISDRMKDVFTNIKDKLVKKQAETDAEKLVDDLLKIDIDKIEPNNSTIIELHIKIQQVEGGAKAYITKLENEAMNMKGGKRTRRKRQPVQKGGNNDDIEKKKKKLKIVNILKQLNSANYIDYEIESIIQELKRLLGQSSTVDISIPKTITTKTTIQEDIYSEPLPVCNKYDENVDNDPNCKDNRKALKNRLKYFKKLKELNAMHNDNALVAVAQSVIEENKENIKAYYKPYAKSDDTTTNKDDKDKQYLATLKKFTPIDKKDSTLDKKIIKYNEIVEYLNNNKEHIVNPQLDEKLMTTNTKQTVTQSSSLKNILDVEHILNMIGSFNMDEYQSTYGNANNMGDPGHTKTSSSTEVKSTDILRNKEPENNVKEK